MKKPLFLLAALTLPGAWQTRFFSFEPVTGGTRVTHRMFNRTSVTYDEGQIWPVSNQVYAAGSAGSSVTKLANGDTGLLPGNTAILLPVSATNDKRFFCLATPHLP